ncbi:MAG: prepilin-type N-terminal cleavage/methylation domain-containing protein [Phormidesmis sp.]
MSHNQKGFTLLEALVVVVMVGIVAAIAAPGWLSFLERSQLTVTRDKLYLGIKDAQVQAQSKGTSWQFSVRERNGSLEWANHPQAISPLLAQWEVLESRSIQIDQQPGETTFRKDGEAYYVRFDEHGNPRQLGRLALSGKRFSDNKRCVIVSTLIGAVRKSKEQSIPDPNYRSSDRYCY